MKASWSAVPCFLSLFISLAGCGDDQKVNCPDAQIIYVYPEAGPQKDGGVDSAGQDAKVPDAAQKDAGNKDSAKPDSAKLDSTKQDTMKPDTMKPDAAKPDAMKPDQGTSPSSYSIAYTAKGIGYDYRSPVTAKFNSSNQMTEYKASAKENPKLGTCKVGESHSDKYVTMSRWNDGTTGGVFYSVTGGFIYTAKQGFHHVIGAETKAPPTSGSVSYTLAAKTSATMDDGSLAVGTITGKAKVNFSASGSKVAMEISVAMPGDTTYKLNTKGGLADPTQSSVKLTGGRAKGWFNLTAVGKACPAGCAVSFEGFLAGPNAERLGFVFVINNNNAKAVRGAVVFKK